jgi:lipid-A-disaccharide synthase
VAGEGSGDALAAPVVERLGVDAFGLGGPRLARAGVALVADLRSLSVMGFASVVRRGPALVRAVASVVRATRARRPRAALLVGFSEVNARLAVWLRGQGMRVLWYGPPQVWAWREGRARMLATRCDRLAVLLPFEVAVWRAAGANVEYVGHPALDLPFGPAGLPRDGVRAVPVAGKIRVAILPGSRSHEVRAHLPSLLGATHELARRHGPIMARVVRAPALDARDAIWLEGRARASGVPVTDEPVEAVLGSDVALVASGTATLECAALGVPPVIVYRTDPLTFAIARRLVRVPHVGLPNLVLGRAAFPELLQREVTIARIADAATAVLVAHAGHVAACGAVRAALGAGLDSQSASTRVAALLAPWL